MKALHTMKTKQLDQARAGAAKAVGNERRTKEQEAIVLARELAAITIPIEPRLFADDVTVEKLATLLCEHNGRLAVLSAEGGIFEIIAGRYSDNEPNFEVFLKGHAGDNLRVDRQGRPSQNIKSPALTVGLTVQPEVLRGLASKRVFRGKGLLARFLFAIPPSNVGWRDTNAPPVPESVREEYAQGVTALLALSCDHGQILSLSLEATAFMQQVEVLIETYLRPGNLLGAMTDWGGKLFGAVARIAGILHLAEHVTEDQPWTIPVSEPTVNAAWGIGEYLIPHAQAAFAEMGADPAVASASLLLAWIGRQHESTGAMTVTKRDLHQGNKAHFPKADDLNTPLKLLEREGYLWRLTEQRKGAPGRPASPEYAINPVWLAHNAHNAHNSV